MSEIHENSSKSEKMSEIYENSSKSEKMVSQSGHILTFSLQNRGPTSLIFQCSPVNTTKKYHRLVNLKNHRKSLKIRKLLILLTLSAIGDQQWCHVVSQWSKQPPFSATKH